MAELYRRVIEQRVAQGEVGPELTDTYVFQRATYDERDVRRLANWVKRTYPNYLLGREPPCLAPFRALLDGGKDG